MRHKEKTIQVTRDLCGKALSVIVAVVNQLEVEWHNSDVRSNSSVSGL